MCLQQIVPRLLIFPYRMSFLLLRRLLHVCHYVIARDCIAYLPLCLVLFLLLLTQIHTNTGLQRLYLRLPYRSWLDLIEPLATNTFCLPLFLLLLLSLFHSPLYIFLYIFMFPLLFLPLSCFFFDCVIAEGHLWVLPGTAMLQPAREIMRRHFIEHHDLRSGLK